MSGGRPKTGREYVKVRLSCEEREAFQALGGSVWLQKEIARRAKEAEKVDIATHFYRLAEKLERDERNFVSDYEAWHSLVSLARETATGTEYPFGRDSDDPTEVLSFEDGSTLRIENPRQWAYPGHMS